MSIDWPAAGQKRTCVTAFPVPRCRRINGGVPRRLSYRELILHGCTHVALRRGRAQVESQKTSTTKLTDAPRMHTPDHPTCAYIAVDAIAPAPLLALTALAPRADLSSPRSGKRPLRDSGMIAAPAHYLDISSNPCERSRTASPCRAARAPAKLALSPVLNTPLTRRSPSTCPPATRIGTAL